MNKILLVATSLLLPLHVMAASDADITSLVKEKIRTDFFPEGVSIESIEDVKFFPEYEDSPYARIGNVCGKVEVSKQQNNASLVFITHVTEKSKVIMVETPTVYDMEKSIEIAREDLSRRCK